MSKRPARLFIAVEGIDAIGKKTQSSILVSWLVSKGLETRSLSFPDYGTTIGKEIKRFLAGDVNYPPQVRALLYAANRWEKKVEIESAISQSDVTIVNRYTGSNLAYGTSSGLDLQWLASLEIGLPKPDLVLLLDAPPSLLRSRRGANKDTYETNVSLQEATRGAYLKLANDLGWEVVNAAKGIDDTRLAIVTLVTKALGQHGRTV